MDLPISTMKELGSNLRIIIISYLCCTNNNTHLIKCSKEELRYNNCKKKSA